MNALGGNDEERRSVDNGSAVCACDSRCALRRIP